MRRTIEHEQNCQPVQLRALGMLSLVVLICVCGVATVQAADESGPEKPFWDQEPYDLVILNDSIKTEIKCLPITLPNGKLPEKPWKTGKIRIHRYEDPDEEYEVQLQSLHDVKLFERLIIEDAKKKISEGKFNEAFDDFQFLKAEYPRAVGFEEAYCDFLYEEAKDWQRKRNYENALVLLRTLFERQPQRPNLEPAMAAATGKLVEQYVAEGDHATVRRLVRQLRTCFPNGAAVAQFETQMNARAIEVVAAGRAKLDEGDPQQALVLARRAMAIFPKADGAAALSADAFGRFRHVVVGVSSPYNAAQTDRLSAWSARRTRRLISRDLFEFIGFGANGGDYIYPFGTYDVVDLGRTLSMHVTPKIPWEHGGELSGYDVARRLLELARPNQPDFQPGFAEACDTVSVTGADALEVHFRTPQLLPMGLLTVPPVARDEDPAGAPVAAEPYLPQPAAEGGQAFLLSQTYFGRAPDMPQGIVERHYASRADALDALKQGEVTVVDRLPPWEVSRLKGTRGINIEPYAVPTIHCLVPNLQHPFMKNRTFRRAIIYGIDRGRVLSDYVLHRTTLAGCDIVSGPFPRGTGLSDASGYAYNDDVQPRPYEPRLALTLSAVALREMIMAAGDSPDKPTEIPTLTLAHPADEVITAACLGIQKNLELIGLKVNLREIPQGSPIELDADDDLLYSEISPYEPLFDARRLFGESGVFGRASTYTSFVLRQVEMATGWKEARQSLYDLHRLVHDEVTILPLWQITEHFAYHSTLQGVGQKPASLYQSVEQWRTRPPTAVEEP